MSRHIPEQGTGIPHITELARSTYSDTFCSTLCFFFAIEPRKIPPGKTTQDESAYVRFCERSVEQAEFSQANPNSRHRKNAEHDVVPELVRRCVLSTVHERGADTTINETLLKKNFHIGETGHGHTLQGYQYLRSWLEQHHAWCHLQHYLQPICVKITMVEVVSFVI